jgi:hypothetical protein
MVVEVGVVVEGVRRVVPRTVRFVVVVAGDGEAEEEVEAEDIILF